MFNDILLFTSGVLYSLGKLAGMYIPVISTWIITYILPNAIGAVAGSILSFAFLTYWRRKNSNNI